MAPKDRCQICGRPCVGRFCYPHLGEALDWLRALRQADPQAWLKAVKEANQAIERPQDYRPLRRRP